MSPSNKPEWFIAIGDQTIGPVTASEIHQQLQSGELSWIQFVWKEGSTADWTRICDIPEFQAAAPGAPKAKPSKMPPPTPKVAEPKEWFLFQNDSQTGPFSMSEVKGMLQVSRADEETYAWKDGMGDWEKLGHLTVFAASIPKSKKTPQAPGAGSSEKRKHERRPLIAKVLIAEGGKLIVGMCRDISIGGMQVMTEYLPEKAGAKLKLNVSPTDVSKPTFQPFVAEGIAVRIMDDRRGFSFRFENLSADARTVIERIVNYSRQAG